MLASSSADTGDLGQGGERCDRAFAEAAGGFLAEQDADGDREHDVGDQEVTRRSGCSNWLMPWVPETAEPAAKRPSAANIDHT